MINTNTSNDANLGFEQRQIKIEKNLEMIGFKV